MSGDPFPKSRQLARGERRYRRKVASPKQWQAIIAAKRGRCRVCVQVGDWQVNAVQYHHVVSRADGGDDVPDNIVPLCWTHHAMVSRGQPVCKSLLASLSDAEYAYMVDKGGEDYPERAYGIRYER
jgi:predicted restriction endonuclease